jgi:hypothetical protein
MSGEFQYQGDYSSTEIVISSINELLGLRGLRRVFQDDTRTWNVGGELYYSNSERNGGCKWLDCHVGGDADLPFW